MTVADTQGSVKVALPIVYQSGRMLPRGAADCATELERPPDPAISLDFDGDLGGHLKCIDEFTTEVIPSRAIVVGADPVHAAARKSSDSDPRGRTNGNG